MEKKKFRLTFYVVTVEERDGSYKQCDYANCLTLPDALLVAEQLKDETARVEKRVVDINIKMSKPKNVKSRTVTKNVLGTGKSFSCCIENKYDIERIRKNGVEIDKNTWRYLDVKIAIQNEANRDFASTIPKTQRKKNTASVAFEDIEVISVTTSKDKIVIEAEYWI